ncbi:MAG TPA: DUF493 domain-containing protein [Smithellaceae bacterium]|nr:DUF493 domain-containing protein [Smithellaceae bacterium]
MPENEKRKIALQYPCVWVYKIIGTDADEMRAAVAEISSGIPYQIYPSRSSATAKYHCLNVEMSVESETQCSTVYMSLKAHRAVKLVL